MISSPTKVAGFFAVWASSMTVVDWLVEEDSPSLHWHLFCTQSLPCSLSASQLRQQICHLSPGALVFLLIPLRSMASSYYIGIWGDHVCSAEVGSDEGDRNMQRKLAVQPRAWRRYIFTCSHSLAYIILKKSVFSFLITRKGIITFFVF